MDEQKNPVKGSNALNIVVSVMACVLLSATSIGTILYAIPLTILGYRLKETKNAVLVQLATLLACIGVFVYQTSTLFFKEAMGYVFVSLYLMAVPGVFCIVYTALRDWSSSVLRKIVVSSIAVAALGLGLTIWLGLESSAAAFEGLKSAFYQTYQQFSELGIDPELFTSVTTSILLYAIVPLGLVVSLIAVLAGETGVHRFDERWQSEFAFMKMPNSYSYVFIGLLVVTLVFSFIGISEIAERVLWNLTSAFAIFYIINGLSLFFFWRRKSNPNIPAGKIVLLIVVLNFIPVVGAFISLALVILGLLETWIQFR